MTEYRAEDYHRALDYFIQSFEKKIRLPGHEFTMRDFLIDASCIEAIRSALSMAANEPEQIKRRTICDVWGQNCFEVNSKDSPHLFTASEGK